MAAIRLTRTHRILVGIVVAGAVIIAAIGFAGSYAAVRTLALHKGFGWFANVFPIGVDAGIVVLLALDLLLTWLRIPFPLLRQTAWLLTAATIAFNGAAAWPDPLGVGMHAIIPVLFVVSVEAARHAIGRVADITADKHMESVRITRWILAPVPTFRLWRRMKLWELRSYEEVIRREQDRLVYRARLRARYGVAWRRKAPIEALMPLRLARYGVPLAETADAGLAAAGIEVQPAVRQLEAAPAAPAPSGAAGPEPAQPAAEAEAAPGAVTAPAPAAAAADVPKRQPPQPQPRPTQEELYEQYAQQQAYEQQMYEQGFYGEHDSPWFAAQQYAQYQQYQQAQFEQTQAQQNQFPQAQTQTQALGRRPQQPPVMVPSGPEQMRPLGNGGGVSGPNGVNGVNGGGVNGVNGGGFPAPRQERRPQAPQPYEQAAPEPQFAAEPELRPEPEFVPEPDAEETYPVGGLQLPDSIPVDEAYFAAYRSYVQQNGGWPSARQLARFLPTMYPGTPPEERQLVNAIRDLRYRYASEANAESIP